MQKGFIPGINGCIEHNDIMDEIIKNAKSHKRTVYITYFDLADAFGSFRIGEKIYVYLTPVTHRG